MLIARPAKVGLIFHSADENNVLSTPFLNISQTIFKLVSSLMLGIKGKSSLTIHFIFKFELSVVSLKLSFLINSISIISSFTRFI
jgi:hypothetical protein